MLITHPHKEIINVYQTGRKGVLTCILVLMTSSGVLPKTEQAPAMAPKQPVSSLGTVLLGSPPLYISFSDSTTKNLIAWLLPCFIMVAVTPWYVPLIPVGRNIVQSLFYQYIYYNLHKMFWKLGTFVPCSLMMVRTPWKKPLKRGLGFVWSFINFTFTVSMGVTANMASQMPAPGTQ